MTQTSTSESSANPTPSVLRDRLHDAVARDLLGPADGPTEEIPEGSVRDRYLVGLLAPRGTLVAPEEIDSAESSEARSTEDGSTDRDTLVAESLAPSSIGLTFSVDASVKSLDVRARWGHYIRGESSTILTESGKGKTVWIRRAAGGTVAVPMAPGRHSIPVPDGEQTDINVEAIVRAPRDGEIVVTLFLVNDQVSPESSKDEAWLFQPELSVSCDNRPVFLHRTEHAASAGLGGSEAAELGALDMLYRRRREFAVGHGVAVTAETDPDDTSRARHLSTRVMPWHDVPITENVTAKDYPELGELVTDMQALATMDRDQLIRSLGALPEAYAAWIRKLEEDDLASPELSGHETTGRAALGRCRRACARIEEGIALLERNDDALEAFRFANEVMALQRIRSIYSEKRRRGESVELGRLEVADNRSWRPFQLGFLLLSLPGISDPLHPLRSGDDSAVADLLWFPTGGGKTEAYFGVAAYTMAWRRLQGEVAGYDGHHGLAVLMRYTLRLLTVQQFQRASALICAMETLRRTRVEAGDVRWGHEPLRLGLWVGQKTTPNRTEDSAAAVADARRNSWGSGVATPLQLKNCPWCGSELQAGRDIDVQTFKSGGCRTLQFCSDPDGACDFSRRLSPEEGIPIVVVDEEIYRRIPSMLISTVDKFAQMPWRGEVQTLFGRVSGRCQRHGFISPDGEDSGKHRKRGALPATDPQDWPMLRPPDLVIQDEMHLISGPLGSMVGLYETAVDELCSWELEGRTVRPKVIASTATIRRAHEQMHAVFARDVQVFPAHGLTIGDDFFSKERQITEERPGRRYLGVCAPGKARAAVLIRVYTALLTAAKSLHDRHGEAADPWMTLVGYFNSLKELGGMRRLVEDDVGTRTFRIERTELPRPGLANRTLRITEELTSRKRSDEISDILDWMEIPYVAQPEEGERRAIDVVLATNMFSVGVDVRRLGLMAVNGQPKTTAEYIQATSRVGRHFPGLVVSVLNWARPRDLSHYETFEHYHDTFYKHVEAQSVTPFAPRAVDRGLTGLLVSLARLARLEWNRNDACGDYSGGTHDEVERIRDLVAQRSWTVTDRVEVRNRVRAMARQREDLWASEAAQGGRTLVYRLRGRGGATDVPLLHSPGRNAWQTMTTPTSMREVEPSVSLILRDFEGSRTTEPEWGEQPMDGAEE